MTIKRHNARQRTRQAALAGCITLLMSACGSQVGHDRIVAVGNGYGLATGAGTAAGGTGAPGAIPGTQTGVSGPGAPAAVGGVAPGNAVGAGTPGAAAGPITGTTRRTAAGGPAKAGGSGGSGSTAAGSGSTAGCAKQLSPVVIGQTLATSGLIGATVGNLRTGLQIWSKDVNSRGGVQCHPVQLYSLDDGSDSARVSSNWNTLVHDKGAVALLGAGEPITIGALRSSAERDKVAVIGGDLVATDWFASPYLFPQGGPPLSTYDGATVAAAQGTPSAKSSGLIYCVEASICTGIKDNFPRSVQRAGLQLGPLKASSLTQSDFTAECQTMKDAGVGVLWMALDGSAVTRVARSCAQLNYHPTLATSAIGVSAQAAMDQNVQQDGVYLGAGIAPFSDLSTPAGQEFDAAIKRYAPGFTPDQNTMAGWSSGKLFEAAMAKVAQEALSGDVTVAMVLKGLWSLRDEKLNGLSMGVTFTKEQPAQSHDCYYILKLDGRGVTSPHGSKLNCF